MTGLEWREEYSVGVIEFDADHKRLIELINALDEARGLKREPQSIIKAIENLIEYTNGHFAREEYLMRKTGYPGYENHVEKHGLLRKKIVEFYDAVKSGAQQEIGDEILKFLYNWLVYHILNEDKSYCSFFSHHGYESIYDDPTRKKNDASSPLSIRTLSQIALLLVVLVTGSSAAGGWMFFSGFNEIREYYNEVGPLAVRKLRIADFLYSRFLPDAAYGHVFNELTLDNTPVLVSADTVQAAFLQVDEALISYDSYAPTPRERQLLDTIREISEEVSRAMTEHRRSELASDLLGRVWSAVTELNRIAYEDLLEAEETAKTRAQRLAEVVQWVAAINATLIVGLGFYGVWFSRQRLISPLTAVTEAISRLASGDTRADVPQKAYTAEIGKLIDAYKIMRSSAVDRNWAQREQERLSEVFTWRRANHDPVTGLLNRTLFNDRLEHSLAIGRRARRRFALMFIDLDRFKPINDTMGHDAGDELLRSVAERLSECVRESDTVARLGGDEFGIILSEVTDIAAIDIVAQRILDAMSRPFDLAKGIARIGASIGIALYPEDGDTNAAIIANADAAMYRAKQAGRNTFRYHSADDPPLVKGGTIEQRERA